MINNKRLIKLRRKKQKLKRFKTWVNNKINEIDMEIMIEAAK